MYRNGDSSIKYTKNQIYTYQKYFIVAKCSYRKQ